MDERMKLLYAMSEIDPELIEEAREARAKGSSPLKRIGAFAAAIALVTVLAIGIRESGILFGKGALSADDAKGESSDGSDFSNGMSKPEFAPNDPSDGDVSDEIPDHGGQNGESSEEDEDKKEDSSEGNE